ncbi:MAG: exodeoxyribonuclease V subunit gamma [Eubacteriales bacterium]|nr:exodeoxyribonuclease V subunit gamma [Eubacteriales bacterium]
MSLQYVVGAAGSGKSHYVYEKMITEALHHPERNYYVIVPEQFTMQTQKTLVEMSPKKGIINIDILSFNRLAYRVFEEVGADRRVLLEETGKGMVLRKLIQNMEGELPYLGGQLKRPGCLEEMKSLFSELMQYDVKEENLAEVLEQAAPNSLLKGKMQDISILYKAYREYMDAHYMTSEEILDVLVPALSLSTQLKDSEMIFDEFTGFTPIQLKVIQELLHLCKEISVTVCMDPKENIYQNSHRYQLFYMSKKMIHDLNKLTSDIKDPIRISDSEKMRFAEKPALQFLESNIFRYRNKCYEEETEEIQIFQSANPKREMEETAYRIRNLIREKGYRYRDIAVITGNMEEYANVARQAFDKTDIPYFIDETHSVTMNPFVEFIRASMEMCVQGFSYQSVFRYLRCGMSGLKEDEIDQLENYVIALGIRGFSKWEEKWVRIYRGLQPEKLEYLNEARGRFVNEVKDMAADFKKKRTVREFCEILYHFVVNTDCSEKLEQQADEFGNLQQKAQEKEYRQIYSIIMDLLDKMVEILGDEIVSAQEFRQLMEAGLTNAKVALIPPAIDQILVGDMERTRLKNVKVLFFVGINEGNIPKNVTGGGFLTEMDREFLETHQIHLAPGEKEQMGIQRYYLYLNLTKASDRLYLSYSNSNGSGERISPAYLIRTIQNLYPKLSIQNMESGLADMKQMELPGISMDYFVHGLHEYQNGKSDPLFEELYSWYLKSPEYRTEVDRIVEAAFLRSPQDVISKSVAKALYAEMGTASATKLERYSACAFAHFLQYGLQLRERAEYEFKAFDMGNIMHQTLDRFAMTVRKKGLEWGSLDENMRTDILDECLDSVTADYGNTILHTNARNHYMIDRARRLLRRTVWALQEQLKNGEFRPEGFEVAYDGGRIDRVDVLETDNKVYVRIIDYKSGSTSFDLVSLYHGLQLQLAVYLNSALEMEKDKHPGKDIIPAGVFYYNIKDPLLKQKMENNISELEDKILKEMAMNGILLNEEEIVYKMDSTLRSLPVTKSKNGLRKSDKLISTEQFAVLQKFIKQKIHEIQQGAYDGNAQAKPYELGEARACTYCSFASACAFDKKVPGYEFRSLKKMKDDLLWQQMEKEVQ